MKHGGGAIMMLEGRTGGREGGVRQHLGLGLATRLGKHRQQGDTSQSLLHKLESGTQRIQLVSQS